MVHDEFREPELDGAVGREDRERRGKEGKAGGGEGDREKAGEGEEKGKRRRREEGGEKKGRAREGERDLSLSLSASPARAPAPLARPALGASLYNEPCCAVPRARKNKYIDIYLGYQWHRTTERAISLYPLGFITSIAINHRY